MSSDKQLGQRRKGGMLDIGVEDNSHASILSILYEKALPHVAPTAQNFFGS
jgi:hypothetical protein